MDDFKDALTTEQMLRDVQAAIDRGDITAEEVANAPIVELKQTCECEPWELTENNRCTQCLAKSIEEEV